MEEKRRGQAPRGKGSGILGILTATCWILLGITLIIRLTAGDGGYLAARMRAHASPAETGLPEAEYPGMGRMTADFLTGRTDVFQYRFTDSRGVLRECFHSYEADHMKDVRGLIRTDETAAWAAGAAVLLLPLVHRLMPGRDRRRFFRGIITGIRIVLGIGILLGIWAALDFDGFFVTFHRIAFTNEGWLLNPATDMLIRLMPIDFFISLGIRGLGLALLWTAAADIGARLALRAGRKSRNE